MVEFNGAEVVAFEDAAAFEDWPAEHHTRREGVWVKVVKKASGIASVTGDELVDVGLCWGWISGQRRGLDDRYHLQKYGPRRPRSLWSRVNVEKVAALAVAGRMREPGLAEVRRAQEDGRWDRAYAPQATAVVPDDLAAALAADPAARAAFDALDRTIRYLVMLPLLQATTPETRRTRLERAVRDLAERWQAGEGRPVPVELPDRRCCRLKQASGRVPVGWRAVVRWDGRPVSAGGGPCWSRSVIGAAGAGTSRKKPTGPTLRRLGNRSAFGWAMVCARRWPAVVGPMTGGLVVVVGVCAMPDRWRPWHLACRSMPRFTVVRCESALLVWRLGGAGLPNSVGGIRVLRA
ncbi:YdeI/OmpD-associated family protein [Streptomyces sp. CB02400]|uniref:YdeI/OmpD-associated family protein n=1 Tax=Streptomyces sp. CB02400 TaxID=1703944 RepID=UPI000A554256